ncbi:MAG: hypothetical protein H7Z14_17900 [Anaerolineae bacterium]|nr:hypothetical protein [Phycisphaerae bacterium]
MTPDAAQHEFVCPICGGTLLIAPCAVEQITACPLCHEDMTIPAMLDADDADLSAGEPDDDELNALRIQQRSTLRRAVYRSRSYAIIAAIVCVVASVQLAQFAYRAIRANSAGWAVAYLFAMIGGAIGAVYFYRRAVAFNQEAKRPELSAPAQPPDFSSLNDGSQQWQNLHDVR